MSEISYEDLGILTIQSLFDSTIENIRQIEQKLDDSFIQVSPDLKWGEKYDISMNIPQEALSDFPQLEHPVIMMAWKAREDCNSLLDWLIEGEHEKLPDQLFEPSDDLDRLERLEKQITQDIKDKKSETIYDCSEVYCLMEGYKGELRERDRTIDQQSAKQRDLITKIELLQNRLNNFPRIDYGVQEKLKEIQKHLISLEVDLELLGSWEKDWMKADYSEVLTHAQKCYLSKQKVSQVKYLTAIIDKLLGTCVVSSEF